MSVHGQRRWTALDVALRKLEYKPTVYIVDLQEQNHSIGHTIQSEFCISNKTLNVWYRCLRIHLFTYLFHISIAKATYFEVRGDNVVVGSVTVRTGA